MSKDDMFFYCFLIGSFLFGVVSWLVASFIIKKLNHAMKDMNHE